MHNLKIILAILILSICQSCSTQETILLTPANTINLRGTISDSSSAQVVKDYLALSAKSTEQLYLVINSPGGDVMSGLELLRFLTTVKNLKVICIQCISMAYVIFQLMPDERLVVADNNLMSHRAAGSISGQLNDGEMESRLANIKAILNDMDIKISDRIGISLEEYKNKIINEWWTYGNQTIEQNAADRIIKIECSPDLIGLKIERVEETFFGAIKIQEHGCPLITFPAAISAD